MTLQLKPYEEGIFLLSRYLFLSSVSTLWALFFHREIIQKYQVIVSSFELFFIVFF